MKTVTYNKGDIVFRQGDYAREMYEIQSGSVGVYTAYGTENEKQINVLHADDFLGEMGMIEVYPRSATAVVLEDGTLLREIDAKEFSDYFTAEPEKLLKIMRQLSERLRARTADYQEACAALNDLENSRQEPGKRSKSLLEKIKSLISFYDEAMSYSSYLGYMTESDIYLMQGGFQIPPYGDNRH